MTKTSFFARLHPLVNFLYFSLVLLFSMCLMNPFCLGISFIFALWYRIYLDKKSAIPLILKLILPIMLLSALINPLFNHQGMTILWYFKSGNPLTLESIIYGFFASLMLSSTFLWFSSFNIIISSDKFIYLFGRIIPSLSLVLSMILAFIPKFKAQLRLIQEGQKSLGNDGSNGNLLVKIRKNISILSILLTLSLENAIDTSDSMKARGYGLPNRSAFLIYAFSEFDKYALVFLGFVFALILSLWIKDVFFYIYFPVFKLNSFSSFTFLGYLFYALLCSFPLIIDVSEDKKWKLLKSKI